MSNHEMRDCFICCESVSSYKHGRSSATEYECNHCGEYYLSDSLISEASWIRPYMYYILQHEGREKSRTLQLVYQAIKMNMDLIPIFSP